MVARKFFIVASYTLTKVLPSGLLVEPSVSTASIYPLVSESNHNASITVVYKRRENDEQKLVTGRKKNPLTKPAAYFSKLMVFKVLKKVSKYISMEKTTG